MNDLLKKALAAKRESKHVEFKQSFDPNSAGEWCELIKDIVAIANSGGGIIVFGLDSLGEPSGESTLSVGLVDPADIANKVFKYTGLVDFEIEVQQHEKNGHPLVAYLIQSAAVPLVFEKPGTYDVGSGKQRSAFSVGTVYYRHGAKSEPGTSDDIRRTIERQLENIRRSWIKGVRKVVRAPEGTQIVALQASNKNAKYVLGETVRVVSDPNAIAVQLTRDPTLASGSFIHEEVSKGIFDEINNVIDANRILANGQNAFFLGQPVYYRIYAERVHVRQAEEVIALLLHCGVADFYAAAMYWALALPDQIVAKLLVRLYLHPTNRHAHSLIRFGLLLGPEFSQWLLGKWNEKWKRDPQPPSFYWTFKSMISQLTTTDARLLVARVSATARLQLSGGTPISVKDILSRPEEAELLLSKVCMRVFEGDNDCKALARILDCIAYGKRLQERAPNVAKLVIDAIGDRVAGDVIDVAEAA